MMNFIIGLLIFSTAVFAEPLGDAMRAHHKTFTEKMPQDVVDLYQSNIRELKSAGLDKQSLKVGDKVPNIEVMIDGKRVPLSRLYAKGPVVIKFYRGGWCGYCLTELKQYQDMAVEFQKAKATIIAISADTELNSQRTKRTNKFSFELMSDDNLKLARAFKLVYKVDSKILENLKQNGVDLASYQGNNKSELPIPGTFVVDKNGEIAFAFVDADYRVRAEPTQVLHAVTNANKN